MDEATGAGAPRARVEALAPSLRAITAPNGGPMTFTGTRSYIVGAGEVAVIDPGPDDAAHLDALVGALDPGERVRAVLVTHAHLDHSAGAAAFAARVGAEVLAHGDPVGARSPAMARAAEAGGLGGGEGLDLGFRPDRKIGEGEVIAGPGWTLEVLATPGHTADHLSFAWVEGRALFSGDLVMGWSTTVISPPDGDLAAYRDSLARLRARDERVFYPGHGDPVSEPGKLMRHMLGHRAAREAQLVAALGAGPADAPALVDVVYRGLAPALRGAAGRNVLAHLIDMEAAGKVRRVSGRGASGVYALA